MSQETNPSAEVVRRQQEREFDISQTVLFESNAPAIFRSYEKWKDIPQCYFIKLRLNLGYYNTEGLAMWMADPPYWLGTIVRNSIEHPDLFGARCSCGHQAYAYRYAGWYEIDPETGEETLYNFGEPVTHDTYLILHWKKIGTYLVSYNAVVTQNGETLAGTIDGGDSNEMLFAELDADHYADNAEVVISRTAHAPEGYNFVGWTIRGDSSGTIYYPGQSFAFLSKYAVVMPEGETIFLDAVYTRVSTAKIIYNANGGRIDRSALDYGAPVDASAPTPAESCDLSAGTATIENLVNNSEIRLSSGGGFVMENATLAGWSTSPAFDPGSDTLYALNGNY